MSNSIEILDVGFSEDGERTASTIVFDPEGDAVILTVEKELPVSKQYVGFPRSTFINDMVSPIIDEDYSTAVCVTLPNESIPIASTSICDRNYAPTKQVLEIPIKANRRLKLGVIRLKFPSSQNHLPATLVLPQISFDDERVLVEILNLEGDTFYRSDLTRALKNKMKAGMIKETVIRLVSAGALEEVTNEVKSGNKGGRPKAEQYKLLWDRKKIGSLLTSDKGLTHTSSLSEL